MRVIHGLFLLILLGSACLTQRHSKKTAETMVESTNLQKELKSWLGVAYKYGGNDKKGVDCSGLVCQVFQQVYQLKLPRTSKAQFEYCKKVDFYQINIGDLLFFDLDGKGVSHVGIYYGEGKFIHASSSKGVMLVDVTNDYFKKRLVGVGRCVP